MNSLQELIAFCKTQITYHSRKAAETTLPPYQTKKHRQAADGLTSIQRFLESLPPDFSTELAPKSEIDIFALDPFDLGNIPDELVEELKISRAEKADAQILELFKIAHRPLNISEVLIGLYRMFTVSEKRTAISARLYRLTQANQLESVEGERGVYKLAEKAKPAG
jgi:hypothetical protein